MVSLPSLSYALRKTCFMGDENLFNQKNMGRAGPGPVPGDGRVVSYPEVCLSTHAAVRYPSPMEK